MMKKLFAAVTALMMAVSLFSISAFAAETTFVDTLEDNYPKIYAKSEWLRYQKNDDLDLTMYLKCNPEVDGKPVTPAPVENEEYVIYKLPGNITGYKIDIIHVNGLGKSDDVSVSLSKDGNKWENVKSKFTEPTYDDDIYIDFDRAYWLNSTATNEAKCPSGYTYIKITLNPYTVKDSCMWNTALDTVSVTYESAGGSTTNNSSKPPVSNSSKPEVQTNSSKPAVNSSEPDRDTPVSSQVESVEDVSSDEIVTGGESEASSAAGSTAAGDEEKKGGNVGLIVGIVVGVVVLAGAGVAAFFIIKKKKA